MRAILITSVLFVAGLWPVAALAQSAPSADQWFVNGRGWSNN